MNPPLPLKVHPRLLGELEESCMEQLWASSTALSVKDVQSRLSKPLAYTTVLTILARLYHKRLLDRHKDGQAFLYRPAFSRTAFQQHLMADLLGEMLLEGGEALLATFVDLAVNLDESNLARLEALIAARKEAKKEGSGA